MEYVAIAAPRATAVVPFMKFRRLGVGRFGFA
jgi:hypothetical protein